MRAAPTPALRPQLQPLAPPPPLRATSAPQTQSRVLSLSRQQQLGLELAARFPQTAAARAAPLSLTPRQSEAPSEADLLLLHGAFVRSRLAQVAAERARSAAAAAAPGARRYVFMPDSRRFQGLGRAHKALLGRSAKELAEDRLRQYDAPLADVEMQRLRLVDCRDSGACSGACAFYCADADAGMRAGPGRVFVCLATGRMHYCTEASCDLQVADAEARVCPVTGYSYALGAGAAGPEFGYDNADPVCKSFVADSVSKALRVDIEAHKQLVAALSCQAFSPPPPPAPAGPALLAASPAHELVPAPSSALALVQPQGQLQARPASAPPPADAEELALVTRAALAERRPPRPKHPRRVFRGAVSAPPAQLQSWLAPAPAAPPASPSALSSVLLSACSALMRLQLQRSNRASAPARGRKPPSFEQLQCTALNFVNKIVPGVGAADRTRLSHTCAHVYRRITETRYYKEIQSRYKYTAHCIALLYHSQEGIISAGGYKLPRERCLQGMLPHPKKMEKRFGIKPSAYTKARAYFLESFRELLD